MTGTFFLSFTPDPVIYVVYGALISMYGAAGPTRSS